MDLDALAAAPGLVLDGSRFAVAGRAAAAQGWPVFPQDPLTRRPGRWRNALIRLRHGEHGDLASAPACPSVLEEWAEENPDANVACMLGRGAGGTIAIDVDAGDAAMAERIAAILADILGETPFLRFGRRPRFVALYRLPVSAFERGGVSQSRKFAAAGGEDGLEVLGEGKTVTFFGRHHATGRPFQWPKASPAVHPPDAVPLVSPEALAAALEAVDEAFPFARGAVPDGERIAWAWDERRRLRVPGAVAAADIRRDPESGLVVDGREAYLWRLARETVRLNPEQTARALAEEPRLGPAATALLRTIVEEFARHCDLRDGRWPEARRLAEARGKLVRALAAVRRGSLTLKLPSEAERVLRERVRLPVEPLPPELTALKPRERRSPFGVRGVWRASPDAVRAARRRLDAAASRRHELAAELDARIARFLDAVYCGEGSAPLHVLRAPVGLGKTSRTVRALIEDPRTADPPPRADGAPWGPFLMLSPSFDNIGEILLRIAEDWPCETAPAPDGAMLRLTVRNRLGQRVRIFVYRGKARAGCRYPEHLGLLLAAGKSSAGLCRSESVEDGERRERFCSHYAACPAIRQREEAAAAHVVFMPHAFFDLDLPEELQRPRAVIADERVHALFLHTTTLAVETLALPRPPPRLTRRERESGRTAEDVLADRETAARLFCEALENDVCPAVRLRERLGTEAALVAVRNAARVCAAGLQRDERIRPDMPLAELEAICREPIGREVREEWRLWRILEERLLALRAGTAAGERERRVQRIRDDAADGAAGWRVRLSWRSEPNWSAAPTLLLDASADPDILAKIFRRAKTEVWDPIREEEGGLFRLRVAVCPDRTFAESALDELALRRLRRAIAAIAAAHAPGRVLLGASRRVLERLRDGWAPPPTLDWRHFGALRGLDGFRRHAAAISIGRLEPPVRELDALAAALAYDEPDGEEPFDRSGTGRSPDNPDSPLRLPLAPRVLRLRDGSDLVVAVPVHPGRWGGRLQKQIREEELMQFLGRLRVVFRDGPPAVWYCFGTAVPEGVIVDDVFALDDLRTPEGIAASIRFRGGDARATRA